MLDRAEQDMLKAAQELIAGIPREALVTKLLSARSDLAKIERQQKEERTEFARLERTIDAACDLLSIELGHGGDLLQLTNEVRLKLYEARKNREIPF